MSTRLIGVPRSDTQRLRPTRLQTIVYTIFVAAISIAVALYLGFFDFLFTTGLGKIIGVLPSAQTPTAQEQPAASTTLDQSLIISTSTTPLQ